MRWLRSWPAVVPPGRAYVQDDMERLVIADYDYRPLVNIDEDVCLLEWDVALDKEGMERFEHAGECWPGQVIVAPYRLYNQGPRPVWAHRRLLGVPFDMQPGSPTRWLRDAESGCDYFGFGCIHFPRELVRQFLTQPVMMTDDTFSKWHRHSLSRITHVAWGVYPQHLHY